MQTTGIFVSTLPEFAAGVQIGQDQLDGRNPKFFMRIDRNATPVIPHRTGAIEVDDDVDGPAMTGQVFIDGIVQHLKDAVMQTAFIGVANVHPGPLPHGLETLKFVNLFGTIGLVGRHIGGH